MSHNAPTPRDALFAWYNAAMAGLDPERVEDEPQPGFYVLRRVKGGPWVPVKIWMEQVIDPETGELEQPEVIRARAGDEDVDPISIWTHCRPVTVDFYRMTHERRAAELAARAENVVYEIKKAVRPPKEPET